MFDGIFLSKLLNELNILKTGRITKISEISDTDYLFTIRSQKNNHNLIISLSSSYSRCHLTDKIYDTAINPKSFTMLLKKHCEGYFIEDIFQNETDRILVLKLTGFNEIQDKNSKYLIDSLKHDGIGEFNRTILPNAKYQYPKIDKLNPYNYSIDELKEIFNDKKIDNPKMIVETFNGISLSTAYSSFVTDDHYEKFYNDINSNIIPVVIKGFNDKEDYYFNPLSYEVIKEYDTLSNMLDDYYYEMDLRSKVKAKTDDLSNFLNKQIKKHEEKINKLHILLEETKNADEFRIKGELLLTYPNLKEKNKYVDIYNYYTNKIERILLDEKYNVIDNSNKFFKKYQKMKTSVTYLNEQIEKVYDELEYFKLLNYQLSNCSVNEALDIKDELIKNKYLFKPLQNKKKQQKPRLLTYIVNDIEISVGKNNVQNEYLTHKYSKPNDMWFHVKDAPGSHVVIHFEGELNEELIRSAATLAAYYSTFKDSSSVAVDYTRIKYIKKIPGKKACFVTYTHQKTIYIDPNAEFIDKLEVKRK